MKIILVWENKQLNANSDITKSVITCLVRSVKCTSRNKYSSGKYSACSMIKQRGGSSAHGSVVCRLGAKA